MLCRIPSAAHSQMEDFLHKTRTRVRYTGSINWIAFSLLWMAPSLTFLHIFAGGISFSELESGWTPRLQSMEDNCNRQNNRRCH